MTVQSLRHSAAPVARPPRSPEERALRSAKAQLLAAEYTLLEPIVDLDKQRPSFYQHRPKGDPSDPQPLRRREDVAGGAFSRASEDKLFGRERSGPPTMRSLREGRPGQAGLVTGKRTGADAVHDKAARAADRARLARHWDKSTGPPKLRRLAAAPAPQPMSRRATDPAAPKASGCGLITLALLLTGVLGIVAGRW